MIYNILCILRHNYICYTLSDCGNSILFGDIGSNTRVDVMATTEIVNEATLEAIIMMWHYVYRVQHLASQP